MTNSNKLKELRTKEEVLNYFKQLSKNITETEIQTLKNYYERIEKMIIFLNLQQFDRVSGGTVIGA